MCLDAVEYLDGHQPHVEGSRNREHRAKVFWRMHVPMLVAMFMAPLTIVIMDIVMIVFHCGRIAMDCRLHYHTGFFSTLRQ